MTGPYFAPGYIRLLYRFLRLHPDDMAEFFGSTGVSVQQLVSADSKVSFHQQMQLCRNALRMSPPGLGLRMGRQLQLASHGSLGIAMQSAPTLAQSLQAFADYGASRASFFAIERKDSGQVCTLKVKFTDLDSELVPFFAESILSILIQCLGFFVGSSDLDVRLHLSYPAPAYQSEYGAIFHAHASFDAGFIGIDFPSAYLKLIPLDADEMVFLEAIRRCRLALEKRTSSTGCAESVEQFLVSNPGKLWKIEEVADVLGLSKRTLIRRLKSEKTGYQQLRDKVLMALAATYLRSLTVTTTASALGFSDESSFRRSFKRWFDVSPSTYRQRFASNVHTSVSPLTTK